MNERVYILLTDFHRQKALKAIQGLNLEKPWELTLKEHHPKRSNAQNARLWLLHTAAGKVTGYSPDEMHEEALCKHFGYTEVTMPTGWVKRVPLKRSSQRNSKEFREFMDATEDWYACDFGVWLADLEDSNA